MADSVPELTPLKVASTDQGSRIVDARGRPVWLRGVCIGGWMNMENFIDGFPGAEHSLRAVMAETLGASNGAFFFDRLLDHFLTEDDIAFIKGLGANVVRIALNYRHFEDDQRPFRHKEQGFERLERVIRWCGNHNLYAILDLHAVQGWQNPDWHSDNTHKHALLWHHPHFQGRFVALWEELARRYQGNSVVAGYDVMNEPDTRDLFGPPNWPVINRLYRRVVEAIRRVDPDHIIFLEGDVFSSHFEGLDPPFAENLVYSSHDYSAAGFGPGPYPGVIRGKYRDRQTLLETFTNLRASQYAGQHDVPLWIGEFGAVYNGPEGEVPDRLRALDDQIGVSEQCGAHWTVWTYKDAGIMGVVTLDPSSEYLQLVAPILQSKLELACDAWMGWLPEKPVQAHVRTLSSFVHQAIGNATIPVEGLTLLLSDTLLAGYAATLLQPAYASRFKGMSETELDRVLQSFALRNCRPNEGLVKVLKKHLSA